MSVFWKPHPKTQCGDGVKRTVYVRGEIVPLMGWIATPDTYFSTPAFVLISGRRRHGYVDGDGFRFTIPHPMAIERAFDGSYIVLAGGVQWGPGPRDPSGCSSHTWETYDEAYEAIIEDAKRTWTAEARR